MGYGKNAIFVFSFIDLRVKFYGLDIFTFKIWASTWQQTHCSQSHIWSYGLSMIRKRMMVFFAFFLIQKYVYIEKLFFGKSWIGFLPLFSKQPFKKGYHKVVKILLGTIPDPSAELTPSSSTRSINLSDRQFREKLRLQHWQWNWRTYTDFHWPFRVLLRYDN